MVRREKQSDGGCCEDRGRLETSRWDVNVVGPGGGQRCGTRRGYVGCTRRSCDLGDQRYSLTYLESIPMVVLPEKLYSFRF